VTNAIITESDSSLVSQHQKGKPFWILMKQEMMGLQLHQLDYMQIICTSLQADNHANTSSLSFYRLNALLAPPTNSIKALNDVTSKGCM